MSLRQIVSTAIARHRTAKGWSQRELATRAGVALDTVSRVEADDDSPRARAPSLDVLERLAGALGVPVAALVAEPCAGDASSHARALLLAADLPEVLRALAQAAEDGVPSIVRK